MFIECFAELEDPRSLSVFRAISLFCAQKQAKTVLTAQK
jgi:hypothetical protein